MLFRLIVSLGGTQQLRELTHVGVQIDPSEHQLADVKRARKYLQDYFSAAGDDAPPISIYWGTARDFLRELRTHLEGTTAPRSPSRHARGDETSRPPSN